MVEKIKSRWRRIPFVLRLVLVLAVLVSGVGGLIFASLAGGPESYEDAALENDQAFVLMDLFETYPEVDWTQALDTNAISWAYVRWGDPAEGDFVEPASVSADWLASCYRINGAFLTNPPCWYAYEDAEEASLNIDFDRSLIADDVVLVLTLFDNSSEFAVHLVDSNNVSVDPDLFPNLLEGSDEVVHVALELPLQTYSNAVGISMRAGMGQEVMVYDSLIYHIAQESELVGLSQLQDAFSGADSEDTENRGVADIEIDRVATASEESDVDSDGDGLPDDWEIEHGFDPNSLSLDDVVGWWKLDETSGVVAADSSGYDNDGTISGPLSVPGKLDYALQFNGSNDAVSVANAWDYKPKHKLTIAAWVNVSGLYGNTVSGTAEDGHMVLFAAQSAGKSSSTKDNRYAYAFYKTERNSLVLEISHPSEIHTTTTETADDFVVTGQWYHLVGTFDRTNAAFYVNGELVGTVEHEVPVEYESKYGLLMGHGGLRSDDGWFHGILDDVLILDATLTPAQVASLDEPFADTDDDGLTNLEEYENGTDPHNTDTDGDGVSDGDEVLIHGTDPTNSDSDMDGLDDGWEIEYGSDPLSAPVENLVGYWMLDETNGDVAVDSSVYANDGLIYEAISVNGIIHRARAFDGIDDSISIANSADYKPVHLSLLTYVNFYDLFGNTVSESGEPAPRSLGAGGDGHMTILAQKNAGEAFAYAMYKTERNSLVFELSNASGEITTLLETADDFTVAGEWYYLAGTFDGTNAAFYVNGELIGTAVHEAPLEYDAGLGLMFACPEQVEGGFLNGDLDDARVYDIALTGEQIASLGFAGQDTDGDGLTNLEEYENGTDPFTYNDILPPEVTIIAPTTEPSYSTTNATLTLSGTASDDLGVTDVTWSNDQGGSGTCEIQPAGGGGTTAWSADEITLVPGTNIITITAYDAQESSAADTLIVTFTDTTPPQVVITSPTTNETWTTTNLTLNIAGTALDDVGVTEVTWSNDRGGSGTATVFSASLAGMAAEEVSLAASAVPSEWTIADISLALGLNKITVTALDAAGNSSTDTLTADLPDTDPPEVAFTLPTSRDTCAIKVNSVDIAGTASDNVAVVQVTWSNDRGGSGTCVGTTDWSYEGVALQTGTNIITVTAVDAAGNSATDTVIVRMGTYLIQQSDGYIITRSVLDGGGKRQCSDGYFVEDSIGQPSAIGTSSVPIFGLNAGYQQSELELWISNVSVTPRPYEDDGVNRRFCPQRGEISTFSYVLSEPAATVTVKVWSAETGDAVITNVANDLEAGLHTLQWGGTNHAGVVVNDDFYYTFTVSATTPLGEVVTYQAQGAETNNVRILVERNLPVILSVSDSVSGVEDDPFIPPGQTVTISHELSQQGQGQPTMSVQIKNAEGTVVHTFDPPPRRNEDVVWDGDGQTDGYYTYHVNATQAEQGQQPREANERTGAVILVVQNDVNTVVGSVELRHRDSETDNIDIIEVTRCDIGEASTAILADGLVLQGLIYDITAPLRRPEDDDPPYVLTFHYDTAIVGDIETKLQVRSYDPTTGRWIVSGNQFIDYVNNQIIVEVWQFSFFALFTGKDTSPPIVTIISPEAKSYVRETEIDITYEVEDSSGVVSETVYLNGEEYPHETIAHSDLVMGENELMVVAYDGVGNIGRDTVRFLAGMLGASIRLEPESLKVNPGVLTAFVTFPEGYDVSSIIDATCDGAASESMQLNGNGTEASIKFRREDIEAALAETGEEIDTHFVVRGTFTFESKTYIFEGTGTVSKIVD